EEVAVDAVRVPHHVERSAAEMRQRAVRYLEVVADEIALGQPARREERFLRIRDHDLVAVDAQVVGHVACARTTSGGDEQPRSASPSSTSARNSSSTCVTPSSPPTASAHNIALPISTARAPSASAFS